MYNSNNDNMMYDNNNVFYNILNRFWPNKCIPGKHKILKKNNNNNKIFGCKSSI